MTHLRTDWAGGGKKRMELFHALAEIRDYLRVVMPGISIPQPICDDFDMIAKHIGWNGDAGWCLPTLEDESNEKA